MSKTAYNYNRSMANRHQRNSSHKLRLFKEMLDFASEHIEVKNKKQFYSDPVGHFLSSVRNKYGQNFEHVDIDKLCELIGIDYQPLKDLTQKFNAVKIEIDPVKMKPIQIDFHLYAVGQEQNERLQIAQGYVDMWAQLKKILVRPNAFKYVQGCQGVVLVDYSNTEELLINPKFIEGQQF